MNRKNRDELVDTLRLVANSIAAVFVICVALFLLFMYVSALVTNPALTIGITASILFIVMIVCYTFMYILGKKK